MNRIRRIRRMCERLPHKLHFNFGAFLATAYKSTEFQQTRRRRQLLGSPPDSLRLRVAPGGSWWLLLLRALPHGACSPRPPRDPFTAEGQARPLAILKFQFNYIERGPDLRPMSPQNELSLWFKKSQPHHPNTPP
ncbi:uncharacterized protein LOC120321766 [Drosophila yakuba]|uniref:uncharacterized protein LOC120321766 n=1 Tax=Drosophila yakuba TaxID=7245 RepID=UPI001930796C|nr:uncharacterized protein LOC120321766 [Drosophila yakuba]